MPVVMYAPGGRRLNEYAESFEKLSRTFRKMNRYKEDFFRRGTGTDADGGDGADLCVL